MAAVGVNSGTRRRVNFIQVMWYLFLLVLSIGMVLRAIAGFLMLLLKHQEQIAPMSGLKQ